MENLFSYGTLQLESVQKDTFGRKLEGSVDNLVGFKLTYLKITDEAVIASSGLSEHPIITYTSNAGDKIKGSVFSITEDELLQADKYEVDDYKRIAVTLESGKVAWVYVSKDTASPTDNQHKKIITD
ncbi:MAG TPA: gamma-glutamylcyclotransferase family protein [Chitinophagaceae bacterium]|nr:gamma-glutamylcyclotransferase family protein [Chitinophagaceae bacterium]